MATNAKADRHKSSAKAPRGTKAKQWSATGGGKIVRRRYVALSNDADAKVRILSPAEMLGGRTALNHDVDTSMDWHDLLKEGLPADALESLVGTVKLLGNEQNFRIALGMSPRTRQRKVAGAAARLSVEQSGRAWKFAEVVAKATEVFGSQERAEAWLTEPATALDRRTPLEMLDTAAGQTMVDNLLIRLDYGVYT